MTASPQLIDSPGIASPQRPGIQMRCLAWWVPLLAYLVLDPPIAWRNLAQINPDGIIYIRKALFLLQGRFLRSVSGYWSPGMSWCVALGLKLVHRADPLHVIHWALAFWGLTWVLAGVAFLYAIAPGRPGARLIGGLALVLVSIRLGVVWIAPDLLLCTFLLAYLCLMVWPRQRAWMPFAAGVMAGLGYLCKSYALPFFVLHFTATLAYRWWFDRIDWKKLVRPLVLGYVGLAIFVVPWAGLLSYKYGKFTISMVYHHNHLNVATGQYLRSSPDFCMLPAEKDDLFIWEELDPGPRVDWSPWSNLRSFEHQIGIATDHIRAIVFEVYRFDFLALILILVIIAFLPARWMRGKPPSLVSVWLVLTAIVYCVGFLAVAFETRYIIPILLPLGLALALSESERLSLRWPDRTVSSLVLLVAIYQLSPFAGLQVFPPKLLNPPSPIFQKIAIALKQHHLTQLFTSSQNNDGVNIAWYLNRQIVLLPPQYDIATMEKKLRACGVENFLVWYDQRTVKYDKFPEQVTKEIRKSRHWKLVYTYKINSDRKVAVYHWVGPVSAR